MIDESTKFVIKSVNTEKKYSMTINLMHETFQIPTHEKKNRFFKHYWCNFKSLINIEAKPNFDEGMTAFFWQIWG